jgi:nucleoside-diphosphate-sugar epimerase
VGSRQFYRKEAIVANVFLTGASGFLGSHLARQLLLDGHTVTAAIRSSSKTGSIPEGCRTVRVDFSDPGDLAGRMAGTGVIYHLAGATKGRSREEFDLANAGVTRALVSAAADVCSDALFVFASSQSASGPGGRGPVSHYGASKLLAETVASTARRWVVVRPPAVIGPGDRASRPVFRMASRGLFVSPAGRGGFALVYVDDLVRLMAMLPSVPGAEGRILQPSYAELFTWRDFHSLLQQSAGRRVLHLRIPSPLVKLTGRMGELSALFTRENPMITREKVKELLCCEWTLEDGVTGDLTGWTPQVPVEDAVARSMEWAVTSCSRTV